MTLAATYTPFVLSIVFIVVSPLLSERAKRQIEHQIQHDAALFDRNPRDYPAEVKPTSIVDYVDYATDSVQVLPVILLPVAGTVLAVSGDVVPDGAILLLVAFVLASIVVDVWMLTKSPQDYSSRRILRLSIASFAGLLANVACIVVLAVAGR